MAIDEIIQGQWCLVAEMEPYSTEGRTLLTFRNGLLLDGDGMITPYRVYGETVAAELADGVTLTVNPDDPETKTPAGAIAVGATRLPATVRTSFEDDSDDLLEYAELVREPDRTPSS